MPNKSKNYLRKNLKKKSKNYLRKKLNKKVGGGTTNNKMRKKKQTKNIKKSKKKISQLGGTPAPVTFNSPNSPIAPPRPSFTVENQPKTAIEDKLNKAFNELTKDQTRYEELIDTGIEGKFNEYNGKVYMTKFARGEYTEYIIFYELTLLTILQNTNPGYHAQEHTFDILTEIFFTDGSLKINCDFLKGENANTYTLYDAINTRINMRKMNTNRTDSLRPTYTYFISIIENNKDEIIEAIDNQPLL